MSDDRGGVKPKDPRTLRLAWLGEDIGLAQELVPFFRDRGVRIEVVSNDTSGELLSTADVALAYFGDPSLAGAVLCSSSALRTVVWPPVIAIVARAPTRSDLERMRRQGIVQVAREIDGSFATSVKRLSDPAACGTANLGPGELADLLGRADVAGVSGMLAIGCPHWHGSSRYPWESSSLFYCSDSQEKCTGWVGRIYLVAGAITLAETPTATGYHALTQMLQLSSGSITRYPFFLSPEVPEPLGPAKAAVARAQVRIPETTATARVADMQQLVASSEGLAVAARPGASKEPAMSELDSVLAASSSFSGAVRVGPDGSALAFAGDIDAPTMAAVVHMAQEHLQALASTLPLGSLVGFGVGGRQGACFVRLHAKSRTALAVRTGATQTAARTLAELARFG